MGVLHRIFEILQAFGWPFKEQCHLFKKGLVLAEDLDLNLLWESWNCIFNWKVFQTYWLGYTKASKNCTLRNRSEMSWINIFAFAESSNGCINAHTKDLPLRNLLASKKQPMESSCQIWEDIFRSFDHWLFFIPWYFISLTRSIKCLFQLIFSLQMPGRVPVLL